MTTIKVIPDQCNAMMGVMSCHGGIELAPKVCIKPKGHDGVHSDGLGCVWLNASQLEERLARRFDKPA